MKTVGQAKEELTTEIERAAEMLRGRTGNRTFVTGYREGLRWALELLEKVQGEDNRPVPKFEKGQTVWAVDIDFGKMSRIDSWPKTIYYRVISTTIRTVHRGVRKVTYTTDSLTYGRLPEASLYATEEEALSEVKRREESYGDELE